jgi:hypothetical protein
MSREFLYRRLGFAVMGILAFVALATPRSVAQGGRPELKRPEDIPQEKPPEKKKKIKGPRAIGVLQLNGGKGTLVPIAILVDGRFYDASAYKADPVPMALESGTVYEAEQAGDSQGLFTIIGALHSKSGGSMGAWVGTGSYLPSGTEAPKSTRKAEDVPVGLDNSDSDAPPRLTRKEAAKPAASNPSSGSGAPAAKPGGTGSPSQESSQPASGSSSSGTARAQDSQKPPRAASEPVGQVGKGQATATGPAASTQTPSSQTAAGPAATGQAPASEASDNYYRPTLRRGKPTQGAPEEDETAAKAGTGKPESAAGASTAGAGAVQNVAAISDAGGPGPQSYKFFWKPGEEEERRNQMLALAGDEVRAYAAALIKNHIPANPPGKAAAKGHKTPVKLAQPVFENIQFRGFDVWLNSQVVMILSAEAHVPPAAGAAAVPESYSVALVARTDIYGNLRKLYSGVTDKFHLDVTPRLELIDAVDADGDGRGELLFRETADTGSGYVIYRATPDKLWKMYDSLNAE